LVGGFFNNSSSFAWIGDTTGDFDLIFKSFLMRGTSALALEVVDEKALLE